MVTRNIWRLGLMAVCCVSAAETVAPQSGLVVHEWGTFTSVADKTGGSVDWMPLATPSDLPCFVHRFDGRNVKIGMASKVRMETPVLYFYAAHPTVADVGVNFPRGMITEWYPQATVKPTPGAAGAISWNSISLSASKASLPSEGESSHYYAARETDSLVAQVGHERDRMLFYRGIGDFAIPLHPFVMADGEVRDAGRAIVFENRGNNDGGAEVARKQLYEALIESGLYPKEAHAMLATWNDSWFEEGLRVFYIVPREMVDSLLPITISPRPDKLVRTFVGRIELLAPWMREKISAALQTGDTEMLGRYGRFLEPWLQQMEVAPENPRVSAWMDAKRMEAARLFLGGECASATPR